MSNKILKINQLDEKMQPLAVSAKKIHAPQAGWIKAVRSTLGMSLQQLGNKLSITRQSMQELESREKDGSITVRTLREVAQAMDMQLVYVLIPKDGSLERLIDRKARSLATEIVMRTSASMKLEDQENSPQRLKKAIEERTYAIKQDVPRALWD